MVPPEDRLPETMLLFSIETDAVRLIWSRSHKAAPAVAPGPARPPFGLDVRALAPGVQPRVTVPDGATGYLFEQTDYTLLVRSRAADPVGVRHRDPVIVNRLHTSEDGHVVHGTINFGTQVGQSRFLIEAGGRPHLLVTVEVFPSKLDYRSDYVALREDVQDLAAGLAFEYLRATYRPAEAVPDEPPGPVAWLTLLRNLLSDLEQALGQVTRHPRWETTRRVEPVRVERIRRPDAALRRALARRPPGEATGDGLPGAQVLPSRRAVYTLDTPEHRWLAAQLRHVRANLTRLQAIERRRSGTARQHRVRAELDRLHARLTRLMAIPPLCVTGPPPPTPPLPLLTAPGYREAYRACLALRRGLRLGGGPLALSLKDLHLLYEYWCFLTLVRLAAAAVGHRVPADRLVAVERHGLRLRLHRGSAQTLRFTLEDGRRLTITYNPRFGGRRYLVPQQPDIVLTLARPRERPTRFVLDAKYRLDATPGYVQRYGMPGPPVDALNTLHRYRDAILDRAGSGRTVAQAVALFPYRETRPGEYTASRHARALNEIGVGAIPLLPGATTHLATWLDGVLAP